MIDGVKIIKKSLFKDQRGEVMHIMKLNDENFIKFGEVYCSTINPGIVKGWNLHKKTTINYSLVRGTIKFVLFDSREKSSTFKQKQEIILSTPNYISVSVPPLIWNAFQCLGSKKAYVINCTDYPYSKTEVVKMDPYEKEIINYKW